MEQNSGIAGPVFELPPLRDVIAQYDLGAKKTLGQNFLLDLNLTRKIARSAGDLSQGTMIEIGPGPGGLTRALLMEGAQNLQVIERDQRCLAALEDVRQAAKQQGQNLSIHYGDALEIDVTDLGPAPRRIIANLPYNVASALLIQWLEKIEAFDSLTLMFQKEVAQRLVAQPGSKAYGRLSIAAQSRCQVSKVFDLPARAFTPPPKILSSVVHFRPHQNQLKPEIWDALQKVTLAAFGQRRKMLRSSLKSLPGLSGENDIEQILAMAEIKETARAEDLTKEQFIVLSECYLAQKGASKS